MKRTITGIILLSLFASFLCGCSSTGRKKSPEQLREMQKDSTINATFFGIALGEPLEAVITKLDTLKQHGKVKEYTCEDYKSNEYIDDALHIIDALSFPRVIRFKSDLTLKQLNGYEDVRIRSYLGFRSDSLYVIIILPDYIWSDLESDKVIGTYTEKYGGLYYLENSLPTSLFPRRHFDGEGWMNNQVKETDAYKATSTFWKFKDVEIYLVDKTEFTTVYTFDQDDFNRELRNMPWEYRDNTNRQCERMIDRLYSKKTKEQNTRPFIAYKNMLIHERDAAIIEQERAERARAWEMEKAREDSLKNAKGKESYSSQDI